VDDVSTLRDSLILTLWTVARWCGGKAAAIKVGPDQLAKPMAKIVIGQAIGQRTLQRYPSASRLDDWRDLFFWKRGSGRG